MTDVTPQQLAEAFCRVLHKWLPDSAFTEINRLNTTPEYASACATHDFCDANQAMLDALQSLGLEWHGQDDPLDPLIGEAWVIAKDSGFEVSSIEHASALGKMYAEMDENKRLNAAAPQMLETLRQCHQYIRALLDATPAEAHDFLMNNGETIEDLIFDAIKAAEPSDA